MPRSPFRSRLGQQEKARAASLKEISPATMRAFSWSAFFSALGSARKRMCLACTHPAGVASFWLPGSQSNKPMRTRKAVIEAGLSGAATGLPGGGSRSAAELVSTVASIVYSSMSAREGKNVTFLHVDGGRTLRICCTPARPPARPPATRLKADEGMRASILLCRLRSGSQTKKDRTDVGVGWLVAPPQKKKRAYPFFLGKHQGPEYSAAEEPRRGNRGTFRCG